MANFLQSNAVEVFPVGFRSANYLNAKLTSEQNLINLYQSSCYKDFQNQFYTDPEDTNSYIIIIGGYKFKVTKTVLANLTNNTYAYISFRNITNVGKVLKNINDSSNDSNLDSNNVFGALAFTDTLPSDLTNIKYIKIKNGSVLTESIIKTKADEIGNDTTTPITKQFNTDKLIATTINGVTDFTSTNVNATTIITTNLTTTNINSQVIKNDTANGLMLGNSTNSIYAKGNTRINKNTTVYVPIILGDSTNVNAQITLKSAGTANTTIIGPNNGTSTLPANISGNSLNKALIQTTTRSGSLSAGWLDFTDNSAGNTLVKRDTNGNFSAGTITATLLGNASSASKLATARTISLAGDALGSISFDGSGNVSISTTVNKVNNKDVIYADGTKEIAGDLQFMQCGPNGTRSIKFNIADNDYARILAGSTEANKGYLELATSDDGDEPIYVRQYNGGTGAFNSIKRTLTLLDSNGNTNFPGTVTGIFSGNLTGTASNASYATVAGSVAWTNVSNRPTSLAASDVYAWAKAATKPDYNWSEITNKPFTNLKMSCNDSTLTITYSED